MTREEVTKRLKALKARCERLIVSSSAGNPEEWRKDAEALDLALSALRPVSREQVEKVWSGCQMCEGWNTIELKPCANGDLGVRADIGSAGQDDPFGLVVYNNLLASGYVDFQFCPMCGRPLTGEAVQMVMERMEKLYEQTSN